MMEQKDAGNLFEAVEVGLLTTGAILSHFTRMDTVEKLSDAFNETLNAFKAEHKDLNNGEVLAALAMMWLATWAQKKDYATKENLI